MHYLIKSGSNYIYNVTKDFYLKSFHKHEAAQPFSTLIVRNVS